MYKKKKKKQKKKKKKKEIPNNFQMKLHLHPNRHLLQIRHEGQKQFDNETLCFLAPCCSGKRNFSQPLTSNHQQVIENAPENQLNPLESTYFDEFKEN